ncbi:MAG: class I SAM-dependent methyltransferase [Pseudomonadota bacterium]
MPVKSVQNNYNERFKKNYLSFSNEKERLSKCLNDYLKDYKFDSFLDIGAGNGLVTEAIAKNFKEISIVEKEKSFCDELKQKFKLACIKNESILDVNFDEGKFDFILISHVLYYFPIHEWTSLLEKVFSWLKKDGQLMVVLVSRDSDWQTLMFDISRLLKIIPGCSYCPPENFYKVFKGGANEILSHDVTSDYRGSKDKLISAIKDFLIEFPKEFILEEDNLKINEFIDKKYEDEEQLLLKNKNVLGIWKKC